MNNLIKNEFFTEHNNTFLCNIITKNNQLTNETNIKNLIFKIQNNIYNKFIESTRNKTKKFLTKESIEQVLVSLNQMVILQFKESIQDTLSREIKNPIKQESIKQESIKQDLSPLIAIEVNEIKQESIKQDPSLLIATAVKEIKKELIKEIKKEPIKEIKEELISTIFLNISNKECKSNSGNNNMYIYENKEIFSNYIQGTLPANATSVKGSLLIKNFEIFNNFWNINETNNFFELLEDERKIKIFIQPGNYSLNDLLKIIEKQFNDKSSRRLNEKVDILVYNLNYNKNNNKVTINSLKTFGLKFFDNLTGFLPLRYILGFSKIEYLNNNNYTSDLKEISDFYNTGLNVYDNIYMVLYQKEANKYLLLKTDDSMFYYFHNFKYDSINTYNKTVTFNINKNIETETTLDNLSFEFYIKMHNNKFKKINDLIFNFTIQVTYHPRT